MHNVVAGHLIEDENGYHFQYEKSYTGGPISKTLPMQTERYTSPILFPFFDGLIPEGWLLEIAEKNWKLNPRDRMGLLLVCCKDSIGAVSVTELKS